jgi:hypothetical protein
MASDHQEYDRMIILWIWLTHDGSPVGFADCFGPFIGDCPDLTGKAPGPSPEEAGT